MLKNIWKRKLKKIVFKTHKLKTDLVFDAYLVATALSNDIDTIATDNTRDFKKFSDLNIINPFQKNSSE